MTPHLADTPVIQTERLTLCALRMEEYPAWGDSFGSARGRFVGGRGGRRSARRGVGHVVGIWALRGFGTFVFTDGATDRPLVAWRHPAPEAIR